MAVIFPILSTFDPKGVNQAKNAFSGLSATAKTSALAFAGLGTAVGKFAFDAVKAAAEDQKAQLTLAKTLQNVTGATDQAIAATEKFITAQQFATGVSDTELRPALENLVRATGNITEAQDLLKLGLDVSAGSGKSLSVVSLSLTKALGGNFAGLSKLGIVIPDNIKKTKDFAKVQEYLNTLFGGQAAVAANTFTGKLNILREKLSEAKETIGSSLIPVLTQLVDSFTQNVMPAIDRVALAFQFEGVSGGLQAIVGELANVITNLNGLAAVIRTVILTFIGMKVATVFLAVMPPLISGISAALTAMRIATLYGAAGFKVLAVEIRSAMASTGIGLVIVALGFLIGKFIETKIAAQSTTADIEIMSARATNRFEHMANAAQKVIIKMDEISVAARHATDAVENSRLGLQSSEAGRGTFDYAAEAAKIAAAESAAATSSSNAKDKASKKAAQAAAAMAKVIADASKRATAALTKMNDKLTDARNKLVDAKQAFASFRDGVRDSITGLLSFSDAATAETGSFLDNLRKQAEGIVSFSGKVTQLIASGLSESAIQQVLSAGAEAGTKIADELIAGGASAITETNKLVASVADAATQLAQSGANAFYQAGVTQGEAMVNGIIAAVQKAGFSIVGGAVSLPKALQKALDAGSLSTAQVKQLNTLLGRVPKLADGGIVNKPTLALIGESGPEAVIPLSGRNSSAGNTINLTVNAGMGADGQVIGREIVDAIKRYERVSGPVFASA